MLNRASTDDMFIKTATAVLPLWTTARINQVLMGTITGIKQGFLGTTARIDRGLMGTTA